MTGGWREGDPAGSRRWVRLPRPLELDSGALMGNVQIAYETWGAFTGDNAVLVLHALTGDSHIPTWWDGVVGPGKAVDTNQYFVVAPNVLGGCQGSTGPSSTAPDGKPWGSRFPRITVRDQVAAEVVVADALGIKQWASVLGGSMGGMRAVEWAVTHPERVESLLLLACPAAASAEQIAWAAPQLAAIKADPAYNSGDYAPPGPVTGLGIARRIAHVTYRSEQELAQRFGRSPQGDGRFAVESYLDHQASKLARRFDAGSYVVLTEAMNSHDVGRDRDGVEAALSRVRARTIVAGVDSDRLYPLYQQAELAEGIPGAGEVRVVNSPYGHDAFLLEVEQVSSLVKELLT